MASVAVERAYVDFERLYRGTPETACFAVRGKTNVLRQRRCSHPVDSAAIPLSPRCKQVRIYVPCDAANHRPRVL